MPDDAVAEKIGPYTKEEHPKKSKTQVLSSVLGEHDVSKAQREKRVNLLRELEEYDKDGKSHGYVGFLSSAGSTSGAIDSADIPAFADVLQSVGEVDQLNLIINSPGGDGTVAEKLIELCRSYCREFRVIVPNSAKSAATIIALGADEIIMGYCSELGPIDAQIIVVSGGVPHYISAQSFIDARKDLEDRYEEAVKNKKETRPILTQIATLDAPFTDHCEKLMDFGREVTKKYLEKFMFKSVPTATARKKAVTNVLTKLSSVHIFKVHGRMIDGAYAKNELKLNVRQFGRSDPFWEKIWSYYIRADVMLNTSSNAKVIESKDEILVRQ